LKRYLVERTWPEGLDISMDELGNRLLQEVVANNAEDNVTWVHSYVNVEKTKSFCIYDAPSPEAVRRVAGKNNHPVDRITEVRVLDPYFFK
jgi:hypothetical protein